MTHAERAFRTLLVCSVAGALSCKGKDDAPPPTGETGQDTGGDADTDADTDTDTDTDTDSDTDTDDTGTGDTGNPVGGRFMPTTGSGVVLSADGTLAVIANRDSNEITLMDLDLVTSPATATTSVTFSEAGNEPWAAVLNADSSAAYVLMRRSRDVLRIDDPSGLASRFATRATTDAEPTGIAISPNGTTLYVPNWGAGNVTAIDTATMQSRWIDLNQALVDSGALGGSVTGTRPGLARPYAIAVTDDGDTDDTDETVYVTEFFGQDLPSASFVDDSFFDLNKQGFVYHFDTDTETVGAPISLAPSPDMGFADSNGAIAGCSPNQLSAVALDGNRLYVAGLCASARGPAAPGAVDRVSNFKTKVETVLYVIDTNTNTELAAERLHLNELWEDEYVATGIPDDASRRYPLVANALGFVPGTHIFYLSAYATDAMFRLEFDAAGARLQTGSGLNDFVDLGASGGKLPYGMSIVPGAAVLVNESTRNLSIVDLGTQSVESTIPCATPVGVADADRVEGRRLFVTGLGRWSFNGQGWGSCEGCHPNGLTDNVTWFFAAGPRQTTSLDASFADDGTQRIFNWTAIFDETADFEGNIRGISGGVGAIVHDNAGAVVNDDRIVIDGSALSGAQIGTDALQAGLNGSSFDVLDPGVDGFSLVSGEVFAQSVLDDWAKIDVYMQNIRSPQAAILDLGAVQAGEQLFLDNKCGGCHGGSNWTISTRFYEPSQATNDATTGTLGTDTYDRGNLPVGLNPAADAGGGSAVLRAGGQIQCVLRDVGTFPGQGTEGVTPNGVVVSERRDDMVTGAAGLLGFNPPSLVGVGAGAPYMHAGNARTLEEVFDITFVDHYRAFSANFTPNATDIANLTAFLQSIDDDASTLNIDAGAIDAVLCP